MIMKSLAIAGLALSLGAGTALAEPRGCPPGQAKKGACGDGPSQQRHDDRRDHGRDDQGRGDQGRHDQGRADQGRGDHDRRDYSRSHDRSRHHDWKRGQRIAPSRYVVIERYRDYGYQPPPRGYRYVRVDGDVLLIAIASGVIADIILNN